MGKNREAEKAVKKWLEENGYNCGLKMRMYSWSSL